MTDKEYIRFLEFILDHLQEAIYIGDEKGRVLFINKEAERLDGMSRQKVVDKNEVDIYGTENSKLVVSSGKAIVDERTSYRMPNGQMKYVLHSVYPFQQENRMIGNVSISRDITKENLYVSKIYDLQQELKNKKNRGYKNGTRYTLEDILGTSLVLLNEIRLAGRVAKFDSNVMICGETGTGKEMFAQGIHNAGTRRNEPFVGINCGAVPENLLESMLFGTEKGAFTGAEKAEGLFETAGRGTLFLDELDNMSLSMQAKLLRVLQEKTVRRVGGSREIPVSCRIISATNVNIEEALAEKKIRSDIYYRLASVTIHIPPLRERKNDVILLAEEFIDRFQGIFGTHIQLISPEVQEVFRRYDWPGNVRELEHVIEHAMLVLNENEKELRLHHIPEKLFRDRKTDVKVKKGMIEERKKVDLRSAVDDFERRIIIDSLKENQGNVSAAAECLGIHRNVLYRKIEKLDIKKDSVKFTE
ncbi:MAG: sigma-54 interaction domain-containing protein, partial [Clostridia bacterium]